MLVLHIIISSSLSAMLVLTCVTCPCELPLTLLALCWHHWLGGSCVVALVPLLCVSGWAWSEIEHYICSLLGIACFDTKDICTLK